MVCAILQPASVPKALADAEKPGQGNIHPLGEEGLRDRGKRGFCGSRLSEHGVWGLKL